MKIALVGHGYVGGVLANHYNRRDDEVHIFDRDFKLRHRPSRRQKFILSDLSDCEKWGLEDFDVVYNLAGISDTTANPKQLKYYNRDCAIKMARLAKRYVFASSCAVYRDLEGTVNEETVVKPENPYAKLKYEVETWLKNNHKDYIVARLGNQIGEARNMNYGPLGNKLIMDSLIYGSVSVGAPYLTKPFICVSDTARALIHLVHDQKAKKETYNLVHFNSTLLEFVKSLQKLEPSLEVEVVDKQTVPSGAKVSNEKLLDTNFEFSYSLSSVYNRMKDKMYNVSKV